MLRSLFTLVFAAAAGSAAADPGIERVSFASGEAILVGHLYHPRESARPAPAVVVTGSWTSVKEQNPAEYARRLAERGYIALAFDHTGFGESGGAVRGLEDPFAKVADLKAAVSFLEGRPEVDRSRIHGLGICAGGGYMARAAAEDARYRSIATVAGWYTDDRLYDDFFTPDGRRALAEAGRAARAALGRIVTRAAVSDGSTAAAMPVQAAVDYYAGRARVPGWNDRWADLSYEAILAFETIPFAPRIARPTLVVHAEGAIAPEAARRHFAALGTADKALVWLDAADQFRFYDDPRVVGAAAARVADWFDAH